MRTRPQSAAVTVTTWAIVALCVALGLLTDIFRMTQAVICGFLAVILVLAYALAARFGRLDFSRKFPFVRFRIVSSSPGE